MTPLITTDGVIRVTIACNFSIRFRMAGILHDCHDLETSHGPVLFHYRFSILHLPWDQINSRESVMEFPSRRSYCPIGIERQ